MCDNVRAESLNWVLIYTAHPSILVLSVVVLHTQKLSLTYMTVIVSRNGCFDECCQKFLREA